MVKGQRVVSEHINANLIFFCNVPLDKPRCLVTTAGGECVISFQTLDN